MDKRATITVKGRVQKAGYREYVDERAFELGLRGHVMNLDDGAVEIICEGPAEKLAIMAEKANIRIYPVRVDSIEIALSEPTGEFADFEMVPDPRLDNDPNSKIGIGIMLMRALDAKQERSLEKQDATLNAIKCLDSSVGSLDPTLKTMDSHITSMDRNIGGHFGRLDGKYDSFGASLAQAASDIHDMKGDIHDVKSDIRDVKADLHEVAASRRKAPS
jgi:acylphosphatase